MKYSNHGLSMDIIIYFFAVVGVLLSLIIVWNETYNLRYKFKVKYLLRPKFKKGDYVLVPDRNNKPTLAQIEYVSADYKEKEISYGVRPTHFGNDYVDFEYYEQLNFDEECVYEVWEYCNIEMWDREINDIGGK